MDTSNDKVRHVLEGLRVPGRSLTANEWWEILSVLAKKIRPYTKDLLGVDEIGKILEAPNEDGIKRMNTAIAKYEEGITPTTRVFDLFTGLLGRDGDRRREIHVLFDCNARLILWEEISRNQKAEQNQKRLEFCSFGYFAEDNFSVLLQEYNTTHEVTWSFGESVLRGMVALFQGTIEKKEQRLNKLRTTRNELTTISRRIS